MGGSYCRGSLPDTPANQKRIRLKLNRIPTSFYLISGRVMLGFAQLVMIRVLTSILDSTEIGEYYLLMSVVSGISLFLISPVTIYIQRHLYGWNKKGIARIVIRKMLIFLAVVGIGTSAFLYVLNNLTMLDLNVSIEVLVILIPLLITLTVITSGSPVLCNLLGRYQAFVFFSNLDLWGKIAIIWLFAYIFSHSVGSVLWAMVFWGGLSALMSGSYLYHLLKKTQDDEDPFTLKMVKDIVMFSWPLALTAGLYWGQSEGYRFVLQNNSGVNAVGKFVVAYSLGAVFMVAVDSLFHQIYLPVFYKEISVETVESHIAAWNKYADKVMCVCVPVGIYIACAGPFLARWLVHANYWDMGAYAAFGAISQLFRIFSASFYFGIVAQKNTNVLILPGVLGTIIALLGTWFLSSAFPIVGTGVSLVLSHLIVSIGSYFQLKRKIAVQMPWMRIGEAILLSLPLAFLLLISYKFGWYAIPKFNLSVLLLTGLGMLYIQWRLSKDVWGSVRVK
jgi:O-antigen/teichoic acid export membrane protein